MTPGSRWRLALARYLTPYFTAHPQVRAVVVGGSVCRGFADEYADLEIGVFWQVPPSVEDRRAVHRALAASADLFEPFPAAGADQGQGADEDIYLWGDRSSGFQLDIKHRSVATTQRLLRQGESETQGVIREVLPLYGDLLVQQWKAQVPPDSDELVRCDVVESLDYLPRWMASHWAHQGEYLPLAQHQSAVFFSLCGALTRLNRQHLPFVKYTARTLDQLSVKPRRFWPRVVALMEQPLIGRARELQNLVEETFDLAQHHLPGLELDPIRERIFKAHGQLVQGPVHLESWPESNRRLLRQIAAALAAPPVLAAILSGALSRRDLGRYADWEMTLLWPSAPPPQAGHRAMQELGGQLLRQQKDPVRQQWRCGAVDVDLRHISLGELAGPWTPKVQPLVATLRQGTPLAGRTWHRDWCASTPPPPQTSTGPTIAALLGEVKWAWSNRIDVYAHRQGLPFFFGLLCYQVEALLRLLLALNQCYLVNPGNGDPLQPLLDQLELAPADFSARLEQVFHVPPTAAVDLHRRLLEDTFDLLAGKLPQVDSTSARQLFRRQRRKAWMAPPEGWSG